MIKILDPGNTWFVDQLHKITGEWDYQEAAETTAARVALEKMLIAKRHLYPNPYPDQELEDALEAYDTGPEFKSHSAEDPHEQVAIWVGSRLLLARAYLAATMYTEAADAIEDAIYKVEGEPEAHFEPDHLDTLRQIEHDLREWAVNPPSPR